MSRCGFVTGLVTKTILFCVDKLMVSSKRSKPDGAYVVPEASYEVRFGGPLQSSSKSPSRFD